MCKMLNLSVDFSESKNPLSMLGIDPLFPSRQSCRTDKCESTIKEYLSRYLIALINNFYVIESEHNKQCGN
jgi:hypothetical protein